MITKKKIIKELSGMIDNLSPALSFTVETKKSFNEQFLIFKFEYTNLKEKMLLKISHLREKTFFKRGYKLVSWELWPETVNLEPMIKTLTFVIL